MQFYILINLTTSVEIVANVNCYKTVNSRVYTDRRGIYSTQMYPENIVQLYKLVANDEAQYVYVSVCRLPTPVNVTCMRISITKTAFSRKHLYATYDTIDRPSACHKQGELQSLFPKRRYLVFNVYHATGLMF